MTNTCISQECEQPRLPGRGRRYCADCRADADARRRLDARRRSDEWREQNSKRYHDQQRQYYVATAERQRQRARDWYYANPDRVKAQRAKAKAERHPRVHRYGISRAEYKDLLAAQAGACAICGRTENGSARHNLDVDHDHQTGRIRGLLCNRCNRLLSNAQDDPTILRCALSYLTRQAVTPHAVA